MNVNVVSLPTTFPWAAAIAALASLLTVAATLFFTNRREAKRLQHERKMKLREERQKAYATMARITKVMHRDPEEVDEVAETHSEIEMLTDEPEVLDAAEQLLHAAIKARRAADRKERLPQHPTIRREFEEARGALDKCRTDFINLARAELGQGPKPTVSREEGEQEQEEEQPSPDAD